MKLQSQRISLQSKGLACCQPRQGTAAFPKGSACSRLALQLCPHAYQPPSHSGTDTESKLREEPGEEGGGSHSWGGGRR